MKLIENGKQVLASHNLTAASWAICSAAITYFLISALWTGRAYAGSSTLRRNADPVFYWFVISCLAVATVAGWFYTIKAVWPPQP